MVTTENLKTYSNSKVHSEINKLTVEQKQRVKNFIDKLMQQVNIDFEISELKVINDKIEIAVSCKLTMI